MYIYRLIGLTDCVIERLDKRHGMLIAGNFPIL